MKRQLIVAAAVLALSLPGAALAHAAPAHVAALTLTIAHTTPSTSHAKTLTSERVAAAQPLISDYGCRVLRVHLNGTNPPTATCAVAASAPSTVNPDIGTTGCATGDLHIYTQQSWTGDVICLAGTGNVNLSDFGHDCYPGGCWGNWGDLTESFLAGDQVGRFWVNDNAQGVGYTFSKSTSSSNSWAPGSVWYNSISSVSISGTD